MADAKEMKQAEAVFATLCEMLDKEEWTYDKDEENLKIDTGVSISARSGDRINVQLIMEKLGGGGHFDMAGAQINNTSLKQACELLKTAIDEYLESQQEIKKAN